MTGKSSKFVKKKKEKRKKKTAPVPLTPPQICPSSIRSTTTLYKCHSVHDNPVLVPLGPTQKYRSVSPTQKVSVPHGPTQKVPVPLSPTQKCHSATQSNTKMSQCHSAQRKMSQCHCVTTVPCMNCPRSEPCTDSVWPIKSHSTDDKHNPTFTNSFTAVVSLCKR